MDSTNPEYDEGKAFLRARQFTEAATAFQKLVETNPDDAEAWQFLGAARSQTREWPSAVAAFRKAESLDSSVRNRYNLAVALKEGLGRNDEARLYLERALEQDPEHEPTKELLGQLVALTAAPQYDTRQAQAQLAYLDCLGAPVPTARMVLGTLVAVAVTVVACGLWFALRVFTGFGGPLVALGAGWLVGLLTAKACGRGGVTAARISGWVSGIFFVPLCVFFIVDAYMSGNILGLLLNILAIFVGISQAYRIAMTTE
ncbi:tetratricopeptide repeat protein [Armatimonas sp.]|uniref:tetratricopeptide repeat protein n=1 Tax=Armatimonas sp. TaxID=1872638 RepID=UPI00286B69F0|nr:tetratricopeptide repeat protein [Armatimonas sp.]